MADHDRTKMNAAAGLANEALEELLDRDDLRPGVEAVQAWWREQHETAGGRRLAKVLLGRWT